jgi:glutathione peroxidase
MKKISALLVICALYTGLSAQVYQTFYDFSWPTIEGDTISMGQYAGQKVMVVNCASYCVYTPEYAPLKRLDSIYATRYNFTIVGYPSNDFLNQGGTDSAIIATCHQYEVNFQIMSPVSIVTGDTAPIYKWLQREDLNGVSNAHVTWNFNKFLIDRQGHWVRWIDSPVSPLDTSIINWIVEDSAAVAAGIQPVNADDFIHIKSGNPVNTTLALEVKSGTAQRFDINLYSLDGRPAGKIYNSEISGTQQINYPVAALPSGLYLIRAQTSTGEKTLKCVIAH